MDSSSKLTVKDNGVGFDGAEEDDDSTSFGMNMVKAFARKLEAEYHVVSEDAVEVTLDIKKFKLA